MGELRKGFTRLASNYTRLAITLAFGLIEVPLLIYWIGVDAFGVIALVGPTMGLASVGTRVVDQTFVRELGSIYHAEERSRFLRTYQSAWLVSIVGAVLVAALSAPIIFLLLPNLSIGDELIRPAQIMGASLAVYTMANITLSPAITMYMVRERFVIRNLLTVMRRSSGILAATAGVLLIERGQPARGLAFYGVAMPALMLLVTVVPAALVMLGERDLLPRPRRGDVRSIARTFSWNTLAMVSISLLGRIPLIFVNAFFGNRGSAVYGVAWRLASYARMAIVGATFGLEAVSTRISATDTTGEAIKRFVVHSTRLNATIAIPAALGILVLAEEILRLWVGARVPGSEAMALAGDAVTVTQLVVVGLMLRGIGDGWIQILYGNGHVSRYAPYLAALTIVTPAIIFFTARGLPAPYDFESVAMVTTSAYVLGYVLGLPILASRLLVMPVATFFTPMVRPLIASSLVLAVLLGFKLGLESWTIVHLGLAIVSAGLVYAGAVWLIVLTSDERAMFKRRIPAALGRKPRRIAASDTLPSDL